MRLAGAEFTRRLARRVARHLHLCRLIGYQPPELGITTQIVEEFMVNLPTGTAKVAEMVAAEKGSAPKAKRGARRRGRPPGSGRGRRSTGAGGLAKSLLAAADVLSKAEKMLGDELAVTVHEMSAAQRRVMASVISGLG